MIPKGVVQRRRRSWSGRSESALRYVVDAYGISKLALTMLLQCLYDDLSGADPDSLSFVDKIIIGTCDEAS
jgi:hypothetical protein